MSYYPTERAETENEAKRKRGRYNPDYIIVFLTATVPHTLKSTTRGYSYTT